MLVASAMSLFSKNSVMLKKILFDLHYKFSKAEKGVKFTKS